jgi:diaminopimelate dehydrogenase
MNNSIKILLVGYGHVGKHVAATVQTTPGMELVGVVRRSKEQDSRAQLLTNHGIPIYVDGDILPKADVAILAVPTRYVPDYAKQYLAQGFATVDSFDIHDRIAILRNDLMSIAKNHNSVSIISAGWDPGSDSIVRTLMQAMTPNGITYTNFGPGMSMGHSVAARAIRGVKDALSVTLPIGYGQHRRHVFVELQEGGSLDEVRQAILTDDYFAHDGTTVSQVPSVSELQDVGHGVHIARKGSSGTTQNQRLIFEMQINNPALTAQMMVAAARATQRLSPGAYTLPEIPVIDLLPGDRTEWIARLV